MVYSKETKDMTKAEIKALQKEIKDAGREKLRRFRESFNPDIMGFSGRREGV